MTTGTVTGPAAGLGLLAGLRALGEQAAARVDKLFCYDRLPMPSDLPSQVELRGATLPLAELREALAPVWIRLTSQLPGDIRASVTNRQLAYVGGRLCAERALSDAGAAPQSIGRGPVGEPLWPKGFRGSITHSDTVAHAAILACTGAAADIVSIGIDAERLGAADAAVLSICATDDERRRWCAAGDHEAASLLFSAKEAYYKAAYGTVRRFIDFEEMTIQLWERASRKLVLVPGGLARGPLPDGHCWYRKDGNQIVALAIVRAPPSER